MTGIRPGLYWQLTWRYIGPTIMVLILGSSVVSMIMKNPTYGAWSEELVRDTCLSLTPTNSISDYFRVLLSIHHIRIGLCISLIR